MKVGQVSHRFPPSIGGIENYVGRLSRDLSALGDSVTIFTTTATLQAEASFAVRTIPSIFRKSRNPIPLGILKEIERTNLDLVHLHSPWYFTSIIPLFRKLLVPSVVTVHGAFPEMESPSALPAILFLRRLAERTLANSTMVVALGPRESARLQRLLKVPPEKIRVIPNGIDVHACQEGRMLNRSMLSDNRYENILWVGRVSRDSRIEGVIAAYKSIAGKFPRSRLVLVGPGTSRYVSTTSRMSDSGGGTQISAVGALSAVQLCRMYNSCGIFISLGTWEGLPTRILEAMLHGCVPVVTTSGSLPDLILNDENGVILGNGSPREVSEAVRRLLEGVESQESMRDAATRTVSSKFDWKKSFQMIYAMYQEMAG